MKSYKNRETLEKLYWDEEMSMEQIAKNYNIDTSTIYYWMKKLKVKTRKFGSKEWKEKIGKSNSDDFYAKCDYCGKKYKTKKSCFNKKKKHYCSSECYAKDRKENWKTKEQPAWKGGITQYESNKKYRKNHPDRIAHLKARRYARKKGAKGSHTLKEWEELKKNYNYRCVYCGKKKKLTKDHIIPLSKGGSDYIRNIQPLCKSCNSKKWSFNPDEYIYENPGLLEDK